MTALMALGFLPLVLLTLSIVVVLAVAPPLLAAKADAAPDWETRAYDGWDRTTWTTDTGEKRAGYLHSCSEHECAILDVDESTAYVVARERVGDRWGTIRARNSDDPAEVSFF